MTLEKGTIDWPEYKEYEIDKETKPKYEDASPRGAWIKAAAEMPPMSSRIVRTAKEATALVEAIHECGFNAKTEGILSDDCMYMSDRMLRTIAAIRVFKLDKE